MTMTNGTGTTTAIVLESAGDESDYADLRLRSPMTDKTFRAIQALTNKETEWTPEDEHTLAYWANSLVIEVERLHVVLHDRESELADMSRVLSEALCFRDQLARLLAVLGERNADNSER